ncbi:MAG: hypothetical protein ACFFDI_10155 [Promethearchaeota archaeon]
MSAELQATLHRLARTFGMPILIFLPLIIALLAASTLLSADPIIAIIVILLWIVLLIAAVLFWLNSFFLGNSFKKEINDLVNRGMPVYGIEGFDAVNSAIKLMVGTSYLILLFIAISFVTGVTLFLEVLIPGGLELAELREIIFITSVGLMLISIGITLLIRVPEKPAFKPGGLLNLYRPTFLPMSLDNILSDSVYAFLDPATRMSYDEWTTSIASSMRDDYEVDADTQVTRLERAREKILLLTYLRSEMGKLVTDKIYEREIKEIIKEEAYKDFYNGKHSDISLPLLQEILTRLRISVPELFDVIDRLTVELVDNLESLKAKDLWITVGHPVTHAGSLYPFRVIIFLLNRSKEFMTKKRPCKVRIVSGRNSIDPDIVEAERLLDEADDMEITETKLPFTSEDQTDIIDYLTRFLQVGDAFWFQFKPNRLGYHVLNVEVSDENDSVVFGKSVSVIAKLDIRFLIKTYGGRLAGLAGVALPFASTALKQVFGIELPF